VIESLVTADERYTRHGHSSAVLLLEGRPALAARLERLLFDLGFEALHLRGSEFSEEAATDVLRVAKAIGIIVIYSGDTLAAQTKHRIAEESGNGFFDSAAARELGGNDEQVAEHVLAFSRSLWLAGRPKDSERTN
jgi:hypothetical protein